MTEPEQLIMEAVNSVPICSDKQRLRRMHDLYGECSAACGTCANFVRRTAGKRVYCKCMIYGDTHGAWSDWRAYWLGCGHINQPFKPGEDVALAPFQRRKKKGIHIPKRKRGRPRKEQRA